MENMELNKQLMDEAALLYAERKASREENPWEYDVCLFMEKYGEDARSAAWNLYCASESMLVRWRGELDALLKSPRGENNEEQRDMALFCIYIVEDFETCLKISREVLVNELFCGK